MISCFKIRHIKFSRFSFIPIEIFSLEVILLENLSVISCHSPEFWKSSALFIEVNIKQHIKYELCNISCIKFLTRMHRNICFEKELTIYAYIGTFHIWSVFQYRVKLGLKNLQQITWLLIWTVLFTQNLCPTYRGYLFNIAFKILTLKKYTSHSNWTKISSKN